MTNKSNQSELLGNLVFKNLLFNPVTESIVVWGQTKHSDPSVHRLYFRKKTENEYHPLGSSETTVTFESPVMCWAAPFLFFLAMKYVKFETESLKRGEKTPLTSWGGDWIALNLADLRTGEVKSVFDPNHLKTVSPNARAWVASLISVSPDGKNLYCKIGFERPVNETKYIEGVGNVPITSHTDYYLCNLEVETRNIDKITLLKDVFF